MCDSSLFPVGSYGGIEGFDFVDLIFDLVGIAIPFSFLLAVFWVIVGDA